MQKRGMVFLIIALAGLAIAQAVPYTVTRTANASRIFVDETVSISLRAEVGSSDAYAIDERIVSGWNGVNRGGGNTSHSGHIKWVVIGTSGNSGYSCIGLDSCVTTIADTTYVYVIRAPSTPGNYTITGTYMFDEASGQTAEQNIGSTTIEVVARPPTACTEFDGNQVACQAAAAGCAYCPLNNKCEPTADLQCTQSGCHNSTHLCTTNCRLTACGTEQVCSSGQCITPTANGTGNETGNGTGGPSSPPATCTPNWQYGDWSECAGGMRSRSKTDLNNCQPATTETARCTTSQTPAAPEGEIVARTRTTTTPSTSPEIPARERTADATREPKTPEQVLDESAKATNYNFYIIMAVLAVLAIIIFMFFRTRSVSYNAPNLSSQQKFVQQQTNQNQFKPL